ncbi:hypothetical protein HPB49_026017 [Dermacentor silvarum]|nr:hypothetical protein HPB49_026017 [Dermacentor silvarum]
MHPITHKCRGGQEVKVLHHLASGAYARAPSQIKVVLKADNSRTSACWETYICSELRRRFSEAFSGAPSLVDRYQKQGRSCIPECLVLYFALELLTTLQRVHMCGIIHADLKPENVLIVDFPYKAGFLDRFTEQGASCLQLIDFGHAIDMSQLPPGTTFTCAVTTAGFVCTEMRDSRPWTFQVCRQLAVWAWVPDELELVQCTF